MVKMNRHCVLPLVLLSCFINGVLCLINSLEDFKSVITENLKECSDGGFENGFSCFVSQAINVIEKHMDNNIDIADGVTFTRNNLQLLHPKNEARSQTSILSLGKTLAMFLDTHMLRVDLTGENRFNEARGGSGGGGGGFAGLKQERRYIQYALMVLLGIFGLTGPIVMKTLAVMAAKALIASKMALIIVGSVALKKIFEKDQEPVKVHTITTDDDDHDRIYNYNDKHYPYWAYQRYAKLT